jgi:hypothetical protein
MKDPFGFSLNAGLYLSLLTLPTVFSLLPAHYLFPFSSFTFLAYSSLLMHYVIKMTQ